VAQKSSPETRGPASGKEGLERSEDKGKKRGVVLLVMKNQLLES